MHEILLNFPIFLIYARFVENQSKSPKIVIKCGIYFENLVNLNTDNR